MKILFLSAWFPFPPDNGSKIRVYHLLHALGRQHEVALVSFVDRNQRIDTQALGPCRLAGTVQTRWYNPKGWKAIAAIATSTPRSLVDTFSADMAALIESELESGYDLLIASEMSTARYVAAQRKVPSILEDLEMAVLRDAAHSGENGLALFRGRLTWAKTRRYVGRLLPRFDACTVVSKQERQYLREITPVYERVHVIPNGAEIDWKYTGSQEPRANVLVFNGSLTFGANLDAMRYFVREVWPRVRAEEPSCTLTITGRTDAIGIEEQLSAGGLSFTGYLPDVRPTVALARACIVPLRVGGGTRLKILEAMALGTPVVSTTKGAEGLDITPEQNILIADSPEQFAHQTIRLLRDPGLRERLATNGRRLIEEKYSWDRIGSQFVALAESIAEGGRVMRKDSVADGTGTPVTM